MAGSHTRDNTSHNKKNIPSGVLNSSPTNRRSRLDDITGEDPESDYDTIRDSFLLSNRSKHSDDVNKREQRDIDTPSCPQIPERSHKADARPSIETPRMIHNPKLYFGSEPKPKITPRKTKIGSHENPYLCPRQIMHEQDVGTPHGAKKENSQTDREYLTTDWVNP